MEGVFCFIATLRNAYALKNRLTVHAEETITTTTIIPWVTVCIIDRCESIFTVFLPPGAFFIKQFVRPIMIRGIAA